MALEEAINSLKASVDGLIATIKANSGGTAGATTGNAANGKPAKAPKKTMDDVLAAAAKVKGELNVESAKYLIKTVGLAPLVKEIKPENFAAFIAACEKAIEAGEVEGMDSPAEDEM